MSQRSFGEEIKQQLLKPNSVSKMGIGSENNGQGTMVRRRGCGCSKADFLPEESFQSWGNYATSLKSIPTRFVDRLFARSLDNEEINDMQARSKNQMKKTLTWWDILWFGIGAVMGAGVFVLTGEAARNIAGPAVIISYLISGFSALLSVLCYAEFSVELPVAGGSFAYLRVELGDFVAFIAAGNILFEYIVAGASVARSWTSYLATLVNHKPDDFRFVVRSLPDDFGHLDPIAIGISVLICIAACRSTKGSSWVNTFLTIAHILVMIFVFGAGISKANTNNFSNFAPFGIHGVLKASAMLFFAYVGFDGVATLAEEIKNPGRDIPIGLIGSMIIIITTYCLLALTLTLMVPYYSIDPDAPFTLAFEAVGMKWAKYVVAIGALKGMTTVLLANVIGQARYFTHIARTHMAPPILAVINEKTGTPVNATIVMTVANCIVAFFTSLDVLANLLSISTLFLFSLVAIALIVRRYYASGETTKTNRNKLLGFLFLILASSIASGIYYALSKNGWYAYIGLGLVWFSATLGLQLTLEQARKPKVWGVPLVPWVPSASIAINLFIMGSIDGPSFVRFSIWTLILLGYYFLVGLHASYDAAKETEKEANAATQISNIEAGVTTENVGN